MKIDQKRDGHGGGDAAQQIAERVQDRRRRAAEHLGQAPLDLHQVLAEVKARVERPEQRAAARAAHELGASCTSCLPCSMAGGISVKPKPTTKASPANVTIAIATGA